ncbi:MAG TPA: dihydroorotate dehydrogenase [Acidimicrobiales bacterium]|nr:dihydroorotate dehydrogenase [Acidimicrobiales bacterium]
MDLTTSVGSVRLPNPVMTASGTAGHGAELARYVDLSLLGAVVVKSLSPEGWAGNAPPRVTEVDAGMLNSVGLQNPGVEAWLEDELPELLATGARVVASVWGFTVEAYEKAAAALAGAPPEVVAVEVNLSCPNLHGVARSRGSRGAMFAHSPTLTAEAVEATAGCGRPRWAKLSPNVTDLTEIAGAALDAGAEALTLVNTVRGMAIDPETGRPKLGGGGGGLSGPAIRPVAVRAVYDVCSAFPAAPVVGVGGVAAGDHAVELLLAGASAVQVGTATFADPRAPARILAELERWCRRHRVARVADLVGKSRADS